MPKPGEVTLSHNGVLFLDELPEFSRQALEVLRQPLEDGVVTISRVQASLSFPARLILITAQNPCPCGFLGDKVHSCTCRPHEIERYRRKISGPLLDRIDIQVTVPRLEYDDLKDKNEGETFEFRFLFLLLFFFCPSVLLSSGFCLRTFSFHSTIYLIAPSTHLGFLFRNFLF